VSSLHFPAEQEGEFPGKCELPVHTHIGYFSLCSNITVFTFSFNDNVKCSVIASSGEDGEEGNLAKRGESPGDLGLCHTYFSQHNAGSTHTASHFISLSLVLLQMML
jgi:hypothetical protein